MRKLLLRAGVALLVVYLAFLGLVGWAMRQPPETFGRVMAKMPSVAYLLLPFETMWTRARAGTLKSGDLAPDFSLQKLDHSGQVDLSSFRSKKPVVLIFGSYT